jgi:hypothetical protein
MARWFVVDTRIHEIEAPTEAEAIAQVAAEPDRQPVCWTTEAERADVQPSEQRPTARPRLRVVGDE